MTEKKWGQKRTCQNCRARFYDMLREPPVCPVCNTVFSPESIGRNKRNVAVKAVPKPEKALESEADVEDIEDIELDNDDDLIADTDDLEEEEDVSEVKEHMENDGEDKI